MTRKRKTKLEQLDAKETKETRSRRKLMDDYPQTPTKISKPTDPKGTSKIKG